MAYTIPSVEPVSARAGDTWTWERTLSDFPASTWTLTYTFFSTLGKITIVADADGDDYSVDVAPATTAAYTTGRYDWVAHVTDGTDQHQVLSGVMDVLPDLSAVTTYDGRTHNRVMLDAINSILEGRATASQLDIVRVTHNSRSLERDLPQLIKLRQQYAAAVKAEDDAQRIARGEGSSRFVQVRFTG